MGTGCCDMAVEVSDQFLRCLPVDSVVHYFYRCSLSAISLGWLNRLTGAIFGAAKWVLVVSILLNGIALLDNQFHFLKPQVHEKSIAWEPIRKVAAIAWDKVQDGFFVDD